MTIEELRDYVEEERSQNNIPYHVYSALIDGIDTLEQEPCEDAINRQAVEEALYDYSRSCDVNYAQIMERIDALPSVTPKQRTGHWIRDTITDLYHCSECRSICHQDPKSKDDYCKYCGAKMVEPQESEG